VLVVGDCTMRGLFIRNSAAFIKLGERYGLIIDTVKARPLPANRRYLPPPSSSDAGQHLQGRMREEIVITMNAA